MPRLQYLGEEDARVIVAELTRSLFKEAPAFQLRGDDGLERLLSALDQPRWARYRTLQHKAAALHFFLNKGHPFVDGNKRFAVAATEYFLFINLAALIATDDELLDFALAVADGSLDLDSSTGFLRERVVRVDWDVSRIERWARGLSPHSLVQVSTWFEASGPFARGERIAAVIRSLV